MLGGIQKPYEEHTYQIGGRCFHFRDEIIGPQGEFQSKRLRVDWALPTPPAHATRSIAWGGSRQTIMPATSTSAETVLPPADVGTSAAAAPAAAASVHLPDPHQAWTDGENQKGRNSLS